VASVGENEEKANTIQPPSCVFLTFKHMHHKLCQSTTGIWRKTRFARRAWCGESTPKQRVLEGKAKGG